MIGRSGGMTTQNNVFFISSTVVTPFGMINPIDRYNQTLETIQSIREKVKDSYIVLVENSTERIPEEQEKYLASLCDVYLYVGDRRDIMKLNGDGVKGAGEAYNTMVALDYIEKHLNPKRIYKISGRYKLSNTFDLALHESLVGKFCFMTRGHHPGDYYPFFHARFYSVCGTLIEDYKKLIGNAWKNFMEKQDITIEQAIYINMDFDKLVEVEVIGAEGYIAPWNKLIKD